MKTSIKLLFVIFVIILCMTLCACKEDPSLQTAKYKGSITVGYYSGSYLNEPVVNIIKAVANKMELEVFLKSQTKETWQADLHNEDIDVMIDESNNKDVLSDVLFNTKVVFIKQEGADLDTGGLVGVLDVGFIRDSAMAITNFHNAKYSYYALPKMLIKDFESGYLDGIIVNEVDYLTYCTLEDIEYNIINDRDIHLVFEKGDDTLLEEFNNVLEQLRDSGVLQNLIYSEQDSDNG